MAMVVITIAGLVLLFVVLLLVLSGLMCGVVIMPIVGMKHCLNRRFMLCTVSVIGFHRCKRCLKR